MRSLLSKYLMAVPVVLSGFLFASFIIFTIPDAVLASGLSEKQYPNIYHKSSLGLMPAAYGPSITEQQALTQFASFGSDLFQPYITYTIGSWPETAIGGEFTGDGRLDALMTSSFDWNPTYDDRTLLFAQSITSTLALSQNVASGVTPLAATRGDFNHDGRSDVAVINQEDNTLGIFVQNPGGGLADMLPYITGASPDGVVMGDFDGDLYEDVAITHAISQTVGVYLQNDSGAFFTPDCHELGSGGFNDLAAGDLNGDGFDDLVVLRGAGYPADQAAIFYQESYALNDPVFATAEDGGYLTHGVAVGDVTGDGRDDLLITAGGNTPDAYLNVFVQQIDGSLAAPVTYPAFHLPEAVRVGDVNHDGRNDVVVVHAAWMTLSIYLQQMDGTLAPYQTDNLPYRDYYRPDSLDLADVNNDGALDVLVANHSSMPAENGLVVLTNTGDAPTSTITTPAPTGIYLTEATTVYTITGQASADAVTLMISLDGGQNWVSQPASTEWQYVWNVPSESRLYNVMTKAVNVAGKVQSPPAHTRILMLNSNPTASLHIQYDVTYTNVPTVTLRVRTLDPLVSIRLANESEPLGGWVEFAPNIPWVLAGPNGLNTVHAQALNPVGVATDVFSDSIVLDTVAPVGTLVLADWADYTAVPTITVSLTVSDATSGVDQVCLRKDARPCVWQPYTDKLSWVLDSTEGTPQQVCAVFRDRAFNWSELACDSVILDQTAPTGSVLINDGAVMANQPNVALTLSAQDTVSGVCEMQIRNAGDAWGDGLPFATSTNWVLTESDGEKIVEAHFRDCAGNVSSLTSDSILLDIVYKIYLPILLRNH